MIDFKKLIENENYRKWLNDEIKDFYRSTSNEVPYGAFLSNACWFVTTTFNRRGIDTRQKALGFDRPNTSLHSDDFDFLYRKFAAELNPSPSRGPFPFACMALDFEGSKGTVSAFENTNVHCHAILCVPYGKAALAERYLKSFRFRYALRNTSIDSLDVRSYDEEKDRKKKLVTYVAKGFMKAAWNPSPAEDLRFYRGHEPNFRVNRYRHNKYRGRGVLTLGRLRNEVVKMREERYSAQYIRDTHID